MQEIFNRTSVRQFQAKPVEAAKVEQLLRAAMAAPSARNQQPWEFIVVDDAQLLDDLSHCSPYAAPVAKSPLTIVLLANTAALTAPGYWEQDLAAATQNLLLEAVHLDLGAVWMGISPRADRMQNVSNLFQLPENLKPFALVAIGYPLTKAAPHDRYQPQKVHHNGYQQ